MFTRLSYKYDKVSYHFLGPFFFASLCLSMQFSNQCLKMTSVRCTRNKCANVADTFGTRLLNESNTRALWGFCSNCANRWLLCCQFVALICNIIKLDFSMQNVRSYVLCKITHPLRKCVRPYVRPYVPSK